MSRFELTGRTALVTGSSRGIGMALAKGLLEAGAGALVADHDFTAWVASRTPAGRWGQVEDLVGALIFLASSASDFVNGQVLYVDGGMTAVV